jgi:hypothetical protein
MSNQNKNAYGLTTLCPIRNGALTTVMEGLPAEASFSAAVRFRLNTLGLGEQSPMAAVPNTYLCRFYVLDDVMYQGTPAQYDTLKSSYLVFTSNFHGKLEPYLQGLWNAATESVKKIWQFCVGFDSVRDADGFIEYIKKCQVKTTFFFNGSTDDSLADQLKSLYLKQEFSKFAFENQGKSPAETQQAFKQFIQRVRPADSGGPTWRPGQSKLN